MRRLTLVLVAALLVGMLTVPALAFELPSFKLFDGLTGEHRIVVDYADGEVTLAAAEVLALDIGTYDLFFVYTAKADFADGFNFAGHDIELSVAREWYGLDVMLGTTWDLSAGYSANGFVMFGYEW